MKDTLWLRSRSDPGKEKVKRRSLDSDPIFWTIFAEDASPELC